MNHERCLSIMKSCILFIQQIKKQIFQSQNPRKAKLVIVKKKKNNNHRGLVVTKVCPEMLN